MSSIKGAVKEKRTVGLDIGSHTVKMIEAVSRQDKPSLVTGIALTRIIGSSSDELMSAVKAASQAAAVSQKEVNISLSGPGVIVRFVSMPKMTEEELKGAIRFEAEKFIPFNINDCIIDFQILKKEKSDNRLDVLLIAAKREFVWGRIKTVEAAGFTVKVADVDNFAMANCFLENFKNTQKDKTQALLNIGAKFTNLSIVTGGAVSFVRDVAIGSNDINAALVKAGGIDAKAAEEMKLSPGDKAPEVSSAVKSVLGNLFDDIKLSFSYHENQSGKGVDDVYITGGGSYTPGLDALFQESFGMKPTGWNPLQYLDTSSSSLDKAFLESSKNYFAIAAGLVLRR